MLPLCHRGPTMILWKHIFNSMRDTKEYLKAPKKYSFTTGTLESGKKHKVIQSPKIVLLSVGSLESGKKHKEIQSPKIVLLSVGSFKFGNY